MEPFSLGIGFFIAALIAIWVAMDANKRGMNGVLWAVGVFLLCIVFLPIYLIVRKPILAQVPQAYYPPNPMANQPPQAPLYQPPPVKSQSHFCSKCGGQLAPGVRFCANCGNQI